MTTPQDDDTRVQPAGVADFNAQLGHAWANPQVYANPDTYATSHYPYTPPPPPPEPPAGIEMLEPEPRRAHRWITPPKPQRRWPWILAIAAALLLGVFVGGGAETGSPASAPAPTATVTTTATAEPEIKAVTPRSCIRALNASDKAFGIVSNVLGAVGDAMEGVATFDVDKINAQTEKLKRYRKQLEPVADNYREYSDDCRATQ